MRHKPRIVVVRHHPYPGDPLLRRNMFALRDAGFAVDLICDHTPGQRYQERVDGINIIRLPLGHKHGGPLHYILEYLGFTLLATAATAILSLRHRYDFVEIDNMPDWLMLAALVPRARGARVNLYMLENMPELLALDYNLPSNHPLVRALVVIERLCASIADTLVAPHEMARRILIRQGIDPRKIVVVPNGPDEAVFLSRVPPTNKPRVPSSGSFRLVTHGSLLERYGIQTLIEAVALLQDRIPELQLEIIGDGKYQPQLENLVTRHELGDRVTFTGQVPHDQIAPRLLEAEVGVVPMWADFVPNKLMEYLALGLPAIVSDGSALRLYFDERAVYYVEPRNATALADAILTLYRDPARRTALAAEGHRVFREKFAWQRTRNDYLAIYDTAHKKPLGTHQELAASSEKHHYREVGTEEGRDQQRQHWLPFVLGQSRGPRNALRRLPTIISRFGITPHKSEQQLRILLEVTEQWGAHPTLPVTAVTAQRHPAVLHWLVKHGVELAAHGYVHNDYTSLSAKEQYQQVRRARDALVRLGLYARGWRCPYSRWNADTLAALRTNGFEYDATPVYVWPAYEQENITLTPQAAADYQRLCTLYGARDARHHIVLPTMIDGLVQIPMSIPQDEDMVDRLHLDAIRMSRVWRRILADAQERGELFVLCLHPERASLCAEPLAATLAEARQRGDVWITTLGEIANWWRERNDARITVQAAGEGRWQVTVHGPAQLVTRWASQTLVGSGTFVVDSLVKPIVCCGPTWSQQTLQRLHDAGYLTELSVGDGTGYAVDLDHLAPLDASADRIVRAVQEHESSLVRIEPWPAGFRTCLSVTGDIDALTLIDFARRLKEF